jgi:hypothetical protein
MKASLKSRHPISGTFVERISISIPGEDKAALECIAAEKRVSLAWVIRDAITQYLQLPDITIEVSRITAEKKQS